MTGKVWPLRARAALLPLLLPLPLVCVSNAAVLMGTARTWHTVFAAGQYIFPAVQSGATGAQEGMAQPTSRRSA